MDSDSLRALMDLIGLAAAYGGVGLIMLVIGGIVIDVLIPGKLREQIWIERNLNGAIFLSSAIFALAVIVVIAIRSASDDLVEGLVDTAAYSLFGIFTFSITFLIIDMLTPGKLGATLIEDRFHPAVIVSSVANVAIAIVIAASIY
jgi:uncharacterized membrane protein YjfL (UPF0719 family)